MRLRFFGNSPEGSIVKDAATSRLSTFARAIRRLAGILFWPAALGTVILGATVAVAYSKLPELTTLTNYQPKIPLRIYSAENVLIGEFGEERREFVALKNVPDILIKSILAIEDERFYDHNGVDFISILRAAIHNLTSRSTQGASTITQQLARNIYLSTEQTLARKFYEALLAWKIEQNLTKDQILEAYMNQIYLGQRAYGFSSAAQVYFGKKLADLTVAEAAMLAGLPKAPAAYNPVVNPARASARQQYILLRMYQLEYINKAQYAAAKSEELKVKTTSNKLGAHAEYVAEMTRQLVFEQFKEATYTRGLNVYTTIAIDEQEAAYQAVRQGVLNYDKRHAYRGPEGYIKIPESKNDAARAIEGKLSEHPDSEGILAAVVLEASLTRVKAVLSSGEQITINVSGLAFATDLLSDNAPRDKKVRRGAIIRVTKEANGWMITQMPEVEAAFVAINSQDGGIRALVGGFDFYRNKFNRVTQAWRQPGSLFKPFLYSASLERGLSPSTLIDDTPIVLDPSETGGQRWKPKNYDGIYDGPIPMRKGLAKSKNMVSIRIVHKIGVRYSQEYATRFGFEAQKNRANLTLSLGTGAATPLQLASAYAVFANGGYRVSPYIIAKVTDATGNVLSVASPEVSGDENNRVIDKRNAFLMDSMLKDVVKIGTATPALSLRRLDIAGKTGTTNRSYDAWFAGYHPKIAAVAWVGFDRPKSLGDKETGGGLALPMWISYMSKSLKKMPFEERKMPDRVIQVGDEYYYAEHPPSPEVRGVKTALLK